MFEFENYKFKLPVFIWYVDKFIHQFDLDLFLNIIACHLTVKKEIKMHRFICFVQKNNTIHLVIIFYSALLKFTEKWFTTNLYDLNNFKIKISFKLMIVFSN